MSAPGVEGRKRGIERHHRVAFAVEGVCQKAAARPKIEKTVAVGAELSPEYSGHKRHSYRVEENAEPVQHPGLIPPR